MPEVLIAEPDLRTPWQRARGLLRRVVMWELWGYLSIARYVLRRPRVPAGSTAFGYSQAVAPVLVAFVVLSAVELVVVDLVVRRWPTVRVGLLVLGLWGLVWMLGLLLGQLTRPHAVGPEGLRVRSGAETEVRLDWEQVAAVRRLRRTSQGGRPQVTLDEQGARTLHLDVQGETSVLVELTDARHVRLPRGSVAVSRIELFADAADDLVAHASRHLAAGPTG